MIANGFGATAVLSILFTSFGFLTFGGASSGFILNNYSTRDFGAVLCRVLTIVTLICGYPIVLGGSRSALFALTKHGKYELVGNCTIRFCSRQLTSTSRFIFAFLYNG